MTESLVDILACVNADYSAVLCYQGATSPPKDACQARSTLYAHQLRQPQRYHQSHRSPVRGHRSPTQRRHWRRNSRGATPQAATTAAAAAPASVRNFCSPSVYRMRPLYLEPAVQPPTADCRLERYASTAADAPPLASLQQQQQQQQQVMWWAQHDAAGERFGARTASRESPTRTVLGFMRELDTAAAPTSC